MWPRNYETCVHPAEKDLKNSFLHYVNVERVSYPVLNLGLAISGLTPGQVGFDLFEVPITTCMTIFSHYVFANYDVLLSHEFTSSK